MHAAPRHGRETEFRLEQGGWAAMAGAGAKLRFAMGVFEDLPRLERAADALLRLGLDPASLCFAAEAAPAGSAELWGLAEQTARRLWFQYCVPAPDCATQDYPGGCPIAQQAAALIAASLDAATAAPHYRSAASAVWASIDAHLATGALLLVARLQSAALQDQAVRALLRHSRQPVHAEEFFLPA